MKTATRPQYHRLQRILEIIREGTRAGSLPNCRHFTRELEVSRRTLMRDLDFLRDDHYAPIAYDDSRKGFHLADPTFKLAPVELTQREVFTFSIARKLLERFEGTPLEMDMRSVLAKIADSLQGSVSLDVESLTDQFTVLSEDHARVHPEIWQRAGRAINQRERLRLGYQRFDGVIRDYLLEPWHLVAYHGNWYLLALNTAAGRTETFALSRCRSLAGTSQHFPHPAAFDPKAFFKDAFGISQADQPWKVRLLFAREVATYIRERTWHPSQELRQRRDGSLELRLQNSSRKELTRWILSWMPHVRVLAPRQLQDRVRERIPQGRLRVRSSVVPTGTWRSWTTLPVSGQLAATLLNR
jgi:predicted DNA-binding transcriptional regulator YafY